ncbi:MAG: hypothetical protein U9Q69_04675 [Nanoarchaeota archaeon]|nr:hypothetical protein [Nanoarchaeota archaeon]
MTIQPCKCDGCGCKKKPRKETLIRRIESVESARFIDLARFIDEDYEIITIYTCSKMPKRMVCKFAETEYLKNKGEKATYEPLPLISVRY